MNRTWRRNLRAVWAAELLAIMGFAAFMPILPYYVQHLGVEGDAVTTWSGMVSSAPAFAMAFMGPLWGALSDRYGRKVMVERAMFGGCLVILFMGFARTVEQLALLRFIQGGLTGTVAASTTLVASDTPQERLGETLGQLQLAIFLGQSLGPLFGGFVADQLGYRPVFWLTAVLLLLGGILITVFVKETFTPAVDVESGSLLGRLRQDFAFVLGGSLLGLVLLVRFALRVGIRMSTPVQPLLVQELLPQETTLLGSASGLLTTVSGVTAAVAAPVLGRLADRRGGRWILVVCGIVGGMCLILQGVAANYMLLVIWQAFLGIATGGTLATISAYVGRLAPEGRSGTAYGLDTLAVSLSNASGPFAGGWLARWFSLQTPFLVGGGVMALASVLVLRLPRELPSS